MRTRGLKKKADLDREVAQAFPKVNPKMIRAITTTFLREAREALATDGVLYLDAFGRFRVGLESGKLVKLTKGNFKLGQTEGTIVLDVPFQLKVYFSKSPTLTVQLKNRWKTKVASNVKRK